MYDRSGWNSNNAYDFTDHGRPEDMWSSFDGAKISQGVEVSVCERMHACSNPYNSTG